MFDNLSKTFIITVLLAILIVSGVISRRQIVLKPVEKPKAGEVIEIMCVDNKTFEKYVSIPVKDYKVHIGFYQIKYRDILHSVPIARCYVKYKYK